MPMRSDVSCFLVELNEIFAQHEVESYDQGGGWCEIEFFHPITTLIMS